MRLGRIQNDYSADGFDLVKKEGLSFIEICCNNQKEAEKLMASETSVKEQIARTGIDVSSVGRWNHDVQENGRLVPERLAHYVALLGCAVRLGAKTFVVGCNYDDTVDEDTNIANAKTLFSTLISYAQEQGSTIKIAVQNCHWNNFVDCPKAWDKLFPDLPSLYIKFDPSHTYNRGADYLAELSDYGERVAHVHIKGTVHAGKRAVSDPPAGMDDIAWPSVFAILYARGYDGDLSIEPHSGAWMGERNEAGILFTKNFMQKFLI